MDKKRSDVVGRSETPPMEVTEEARAEHLDMARAQGQAMGQALREMTQNVADAGEEVAMGHYLVGYAVEKPEGMWVPNDGELEWHGPEGNVHIEISVRDGADGRFIPGLDVNLIVLDADGNEVGSQRQPFIWHPWLYHYGRNWELPGSGTYILRVQIGMPTFHRHDRKNGRRYLEPVEVEFMDVQIETSRPQSR